MRLWITLIALLVAMPLSAKLPAGANVGADAGKAGETAIGAQADDLAQKKLMPMGAAIATGLRFNGTATPELNINDSKPADQAAKGNLADAKNYDGMTGGGKSANPNTTTPDGKKPKTRAADKGGSKPVVGDKDGLSLDVDTNLHLKGAAIATGLRFNGTATPELNINDNKPADQAGKGNVADAKNYDGLMGGGKSTNPNTQNPNPKKDKDEQGSSKEKGGEVKSPVSDVADKNLPKMNMAVATGLRFNGTALPTDLKAGKPKPNSDNLKVGNVATADTGADKPKIGSTDQAMMGHVAKDSAPKQKPRQAAAQKDVKGLVSIQLLRVKPSGGVSPFQLSDVRSKIDPAARQAQAPAVVGREPAAPEPTAAPTSTPPSTPTPSAAAPVVTRRAVSGGAAPVAAFDCSGKADGNYCKDSATQVFCYKDGVMNVMPCPSGCDAGTGKCAPYKP